MNIQDVPFLADADDRDGAPTQSPARRLAMSDLTVRKDARPRIEWVFKNACAGAEGIRRE
jgi:hypothetical protein